MGHCNNNNSFFKINTKWIVLGSMKKFILFPVQLCFRQSDSERMLI